MAEQSSNYPSPPQAAHNNVPFFPDVVSAENQVEIDLVEQLNQHINPELQPSSQQRNHDDDQNVAQAMAREVMNLGHDDSHIQQQSNPHPSPNSRSHQPHHQQQSHQYNHAQRPPSIPASAAKLRTKVSRACDECRRKKIRCDAPLEGDHIQCTACKKANFNCQFSRQPQKRGPSKGYIRDLADRLSSLEGQFRVDGSGSHPVGGGGVGLTNENYASMVENESEALPEYKPSKRTRSPSNDPDDDHYAQNGRNGFPPQTSSQPPTVEESHLDEQLIEIYYRSIHPTIPIFPSNPNLLRTYITDLPNATRIALLSAMQLALQSPPYTGSPEFRPPERDPEDLIRVAKKTDAAQLARSQAFLFLTIAANNQGTEILNEGQFSKESPRIFLNRAIESGEALNIFDAVAAAHADVNLHLTLSRYIALTTCVVDVMTFLALRKPGDRAMMPPVLTEKDHHVVGWRLYTLARFCRVLVRLQTFRLVPGIVEQIQEIGLETQISVTNSLLLKERRAYFVESLNLYAAASSEVSSDHVINLCYWYCLIALELHFYPIFSFERVFDYSRNMVDRIAEMEGTHPLLHHFAGLLAHILIQLSGFIETRQESLQLLQLLDSALNHLIPADIDNRSFNALVRDAVTRKRAQLSVNANSMSLDHLANVAANPRNNQYDRNDHSDGIAAAAAAAAQAAMGMQSSTVSEAKEWDSSEISQEAYLLALSR